MNEIYQILNVIDSDGFTVLRVRNTQTNEEQVCYLSQNITISKNRLYSANELQIL